MLISAVGSLITHQPALLVWGVGDGQCRSEWGHSESAFISCSSYFRNKKEWNWNLCLEHSGCCWWQGCHQPWGQWEGWTHCQQEDDLSWHETEKEPKTGMKRKTLRKSQNRIIFMNYILAVITLCSLLCWLGLSVRIPHFPRWVLAWGEFRLGWLWGTA